MDIAQIMRQLQQELPLNDFGLPLGLYWSDLLPFHLHSEGHSGHLNPEGQVGQTLLPQESCTDDSPEILPEDSPLPDADVVDARSDDSSDPLPIDDLEPEIDPFAILAGDAPNPTPRRREGNGAGASSNHVLVTQPREYSIAGFPAASIQVAWVPLQYDEGFPAFDSGSAFWDRMAFEPNDAFQAFQRYCFMARGVASDYTDDDGLGEAAAGTRSISNLAHQLLGTEADDIRILALTDKFKEHYHLYYWNLRVRAYDLYRAAQHRQQQELRAIETQDDHYIQSRALRHRLAQYMDSEEEFWDLMTPKVAVDMLKQLTALERISAGIPAAGPSGENERTGQPFEMALRTIAQVHGGSATEGTLVDEEGSILDIALTDPKATQLLQELVIRSGGGGDK